MRKMIIEIKDETTVEELSNAIAHLGYINLNEYEVLKAELDKYKELTNTIHTPSYVRHDDFYTRGIWYCADDSDLTVDIERNMYDEL